MKFWGAVRNAEPVPAPWPLGRVLQFHKAEIERSRISYTQCSTSERALLLSPITGPQIVQGVMTSTGSPPLTRMVSLRSSILRSSRPFL